MDEVGVIFRMKKCLLNIKEAMKGDAYMHFAVIQLIPCTSATHQRYFQHVRIDISDVGLYSM